jgi:hypothetical protein
MNEIFALLKEAPDNPPCEIIMNKYHEPGFAGVLILDFLDFIYKE